MSSSVILRPEILLIGNRSYRVNPSTLPGLEPVQQVYREEEESDYYPQSNPVDHTNDDDDDEPSCKIQVTRTTTDSEEKPKTTGI